MSYRHRMRRIMSPWKDQKRQKGYQSNRKKGKKGKGISIGTGAQRRGIIGTCNPTAARRYLNASRSVETSRAPAIMRNNKRRPFHDWRIHIPPTGVARSHPYEIFLLFIAFYGTLLGPQMKKNVRRTTSSSTSSQSLFAILNGQIFEETRINPGGTVRK